MKKRQYLMIKGIGVIVSLLLLTVSILLCGQMQIVLSGQGKTEREVSFAQSQVERTVSFRRGETVRIESSYFQLKKAEQLLRQEIRSIRGVDKQSEALNNKVQPRNRLCVSLLFLLLTELIWECILKYQRLRHTEFREKTYFYSRVSKRRGPPIAAALC